MGEPCLKLERVPTSDGSPDLFRYQIPGGWVVGVGPRLRTAFFKPDPEHDWGNPEVAMDGVCPWSDHDLDVLSSTQDAEDRHCASCGRHYEVTVYPHPEDEA